MLDKILRSNMVCTRMDKKQAFGVAKIIRLKYLLHYSISVLNVGADVTSEFWMYLD